MNNLLRKLDLTSLRLFVAVCQERNIARAAEREFIAPSAVSRRIAEIEAAIGLPVIERKSRGIAITPVGETLLRHAQLVIGNIETLGAELSQFFSGAKGNIKLVANLSSIVQFLPEDIASFQRQFPDVRIDVEEQNSADVLRSIEEHSADFGICNVIPGIERFTQWPYRTDRLSLAVPRSHRLATAPQVTLAEVVHENFVSLPSKSTLSLRIAEEAARLGSPISMSISFRVSSIDALCRMVRAGLGIAVIPHLMGEPNASSLDLVMVPLADPWAVRQLVIVANGREQLTAAAATLVNFLSRQD
ncbi:LysR family transcriptional regulator [Massilia sp. LXY-6]|uniref:LysR family transcriptional regulator n=1 Tax=Massilia sp. LXY-6 TaxID=3379823 RepID=UPI003EDF8027